MKAQKVGKMAIFSVGAVLFSAHAGGGFATGNQANTYYVGLGWTGIVSAIIAMLLLILTMREAMVMYNQRNLTSAKELFENLYHPFDKLEILFEIFFNIMVLMAVAAAISGAASALQQYFGFNYYACVVAVGIVVLCLTIFGADVVRLASTYMGMAILVTAIVIYGMGIMKGQNIGAILANDFTVNGFMDMPKAILNAIYICRLSMCDITNDRSMWSYLTRSKILFKSNVGLICDECCRISIKCIDVNFLEECLWRNNSSYIDEFKYDECQLDGCCIWYLFITLLNFYSSNNNIRICGSL